MELERDFYLKFYPILHTKFRRKVYPNSPNEESEGKYSPEVWKAYDSEEEKFKVAVFFEGLSGRCGKNYFYSRYLAFEKDLKKEKGKIDSLTLFKALVFVEVDKGKKENGQILDFDSLNSDKGWGKVYSLKVLKHLMDLFMKNPNKYLDEEFIEEISIANLISRVSEFRKPSIIEEFLEEKLENKKISIDESTKLDLYSYIFDLSKPIAKRTIAMRYFMFQPMLTCEEIIGLVLHPQDEFPKEVIRVLSSFAGKIKNEEEIFELIKACNIAVVNRFPELVCAFCHQALQMNFTFGMLVTKETLARLILDKRMNVLSVCNIMNYVSEAIKDIEHFEFKSDKLSAYISVDAISCMQEIARINYLFIDGTERYKNVNALKLILFEKHRKIYDISADFFLSLLGDEDIDFYKCEIIDKKLREFYYWSIEPTHQTTFFYS